MTKFKKRVRELLDAGYPWRQAYAIAKSEQHKQKNVKNRRTKRKA